MIKVICSIYDNKAKAFCTPFFSATNETAQRDFAYAANDKDNGIGRYPMDYTLFRIGTFDDDLGIIASEMHSNLGLASNFVGELNV